MGKRRNLGAALTMGAVATTKLKEAQEEIPESPRSIPIICGKTQRSMRNYQQQF